MKGSSGALHNFQLSSGSSNRPPIRDRSNWFPNPVPDKTNSGADTDLKNPSHHTALDIAIAKNTGTQELLRSGSMVEGPTIAEKNRNGKKVAQLVPTHSFKAPRDNPAKMAACRMFTATMIEFYIEGKERRSPPISTSIYELLYGKGPRAICKEKFTEKPDESPSFTWYHMPANNVSSRRCLLSLLL